MDWMLGTYFQQQQPDDSIHSFIGTVRSEGVMGAGASLNNIFVTWSFYVAMLMRSDMP